MTRIEQREEAVRLYTTLDAIAYTDYLIDTVGWDTVANDPGAEADYLMDRASTFASEMGVLASSAWSPRAQFEADRATAESNWVLYGMYQGAALVRRLLSPTTEGRFAEGIDGQKNR